MEISVRVCVWWQMKFIIKIKSRWSGNNVCFEQIMGAKHRERFGRESEIDVSDSMFDSTEESERQTRKRRVCAAVKEIIEFGPNHIQIKIELVCCFDYTFQIDERQLACGKATESDI